LTETQNAKGVDLQLVFATPDKVSKHKIKDVFIVALNEDFILRSDIPR
jgi:hypothetical protein